MSIKSIRPILILLTVLIALSLADSIQAGEASLSADIFSDNLLQGPGGLVVQASSTPTYVEPSAVPVVVSTPLPDGSIIHIIAAGQSLWAVSEAYDIPFQDLLDLNDLDPDAIINVGDEVVISPSYTPTSTPIGEPSPTPPPRYSHTPSLGTPQGTSQSFSPATPVPTETLLVEPRFRTSVKNPLIVIAAVLISGGALAAALFFSFRGRE